MYFYVHDDMRFYCNFGSFIHVSTRIIFPVEVSVRLQQSICSTLAIYLWFTRVLPPDACLLLFIWTLLFL